MAKIIVMLIISDELCFKLNHHSKQQIEKQELVRRASIGEHSE